MRCHRNPLAPDMLIHAGHGIQKRGSRYVVQPYNRDFGTLAAAKRWVEKHVRREMAEPTPNPRRTLPPKPLDLYDLNAHALLQVVDRLPSKVAKQYRAARERGSSTRIAAIAAIEAAYARQNAARKNPRKPKALSGGDIMSLVPVAYKGRMIYGKNFCASDNLQPWETDAIVERLAKEGCTTAVEHDAAPARGLRPFRTVIRVFPTAQLR
jgi:hypothetical protein